MYFYCLGIEAKRLASFMYLLQRWKQDALYVVSALMRAALSFNMLFVLLKESSNTFT